MYQSFLTFIEKKGLLSRDEKVLVAVSGGVDSVVLLHLLKKADYSLGVAHVNYRLRGKESDMDALLVEDLCEEYGIPFHLHEVDPKVYDSGGSIQMIARNIRYQFFKELQKREKYTKVATAHHSNDNLETALFNLSKGTGIAGLTGIAPKKGKRVRPLLFSHKDEIYQYAKNQNLKWREDQSNQKNDYNRNLIRNKVVPVLQQINPSILDTFQDSLTRFRGAADLLELHKVELESRHKAEEEGYDSLQVSWVKDDDLSHTMLFEILKVYGLNFRQTEDLLNAIVSRSVGAVFSTLEVDINLDREKLIISKAGKGDYVSKKVQKGEKQVQIGEMLISFDFLDGNEPMRDADSACLDADKITFPLVVRTWRQGDSFQPLGMKGKKKVSDFMIDSKIPLTLKKNVLVLESEGNILWLIGHRIDDRYKVTTSTRQMLNITISHV